MLAVRELDPQLIMKSLLNFLAWDQVHQYASIQSVLQSAFAPNRSIKARKGNTQQYGRKAMSTLCDM